ncbi:MAG: UDP-2,3-diacylglucosamine diphosphatase LpxI [Elusimicrobia bacterium]|nr:UDP-2,3-diacylglucosamine diphosphatase LpxI [Elusimicrobiota bacterium]
MAREAKRQGLEVVALGIPGVTDKALEELVGEIHYFKLGQIDKPIQTLKTAGAQKAVMAGKIQHVSLFGGLLPDMRAAKLLARIPDKRTDTILKAVADEFAKDGIALLSSAAYLSHLLVPEGPLTSRKPNPLEEADIRLGWKAAKALAGFDIGQTVVVQGGAVVAVEAMEGTDACVERASALARSFGKDPRLTVVKVAKPKQDLRFDIPIVGLDSLKTFAKANVSALALEAGSTLIFDKERFLEEAGGLKLAIAGLKAEAFS